MFSKEQWLRSARHETQVCKHLYGKIGEGMLDYRPAPGQRSMLELLQYLSVCMIGPIRGMIEGDFNVARAMIKDSAEMKAEEFIAALDKQMAAVEELVQSFTEDELLTREVPLPTGQTTILGEGLINWPLKFVTAYRMQLFLYIKANGVEGLTTWNCWFGMDNPKS
ncbi:MAG: hypothetical protein GC154_04865 [bacterium]|nr:hypothetical protein [bacterium]